MAELPRGKISPLAAPPTHIEQQPEISDMWVADGLFTPDLEASTDSPPPYGELHDQFQLSQDGFEAAAAVAGEETCVAPSLCCQLTPVM